MRNSAIIVGAAAFSLAHGASAALVQRDSNDFENDANNGATAHYEATAIPQNSTPAWASPGSGQAYGVSGGELTLTTGTSTDNRYFYDQAGIFWANDAERATGYTVEFRMRIDQITDATRGPVLVRIADGTQHVELEWRSNAIVWNGSTTTIDPSGYLVYRVAYDPAANGGAGAYAAWINGSLVSDTLNGANSTADYLLFGDTSNSRYGGTTTWDYIRWDTTGAFAPVPEPTALALLAISAFAATLRSRSRR